MSFGASLAWYNFWTKFCFINGFRGLKNTIKHYIVAENEENLSSCFRENSKYIMLDYFSEKKMLLMNGLTNNTEFIGPFPFGVQFKVNLHQLLLFIYSSLESENYFQFS